MARSRVNVMMDSDLQERVKDLAVRQRRTFSSMIDEAMELLLAKASEDDRKVRGAIETIVRETEKASLPGGKDADD